MIDWSRTEEMLTESFELLPGIEVPTGRYRFDRVRLSLEGSFERAFAR